MARIISTKNVHKAYFPTWEPGVLRLIADCQATFFQQLPAVTIVIY